MNILENIDIEPGVFRDISNCHGPHSCSCSNKREDAYTVD